MDQKGPWINRTSTAAPRAVASAVPPPEADDGPDQQKEQESFALLSFELRRFTRPDSRITPEIEAKVVNRCILAALEVLADEDASVDLAGTTVRPVIEARFEGTESPAAASRAALTVLDSVRRVQRARENEFQLVGALASGTLSRSDNGVVVTSGPVEATLTRLRERAAPGQILMSAEAKAACGSLIDATPSHEGTGPGSEAYVLRGLRSTT